jgi:Raf kinase inhibitor-like YbhB/YbcL family protein
VAVRRRFLVALALAGLVAGALGACSEADGRALPPADPQLTTTSTSTVPSLQPGTGDGGVFTLRSSAFGDGTTMPEELTCTGAGVSPDLSWTDTPADAETLALVVRDRNAGAFVHWVVTGIDPSVQGIGEGGVPEGAVEGPNDAGTVGWLAPCPTAGSGTHTYEVALLALPGVVAIPPDANGQQAAALIEASASERAVLTGTVTAGG